uniref:Uncharacterized protein n=1 Tax=viral metagenome TaxID=1070528 RepID=A0A6C0I8E0_9ZZZZ
MDAKLNKVKTNFNKIKDIRIAVVNIITTLEVKITKLKGMTNDFIKNNQETLFVFGLDSFMFQSKMIDYEYADMQKYFLALNNRMYCEYYKLYKIVSEYIEQNNGISQNKTFEMIKANSKFPIYKDLEPYKQYNFDTIEDVHKTIISLLNIINDYIVLKDAELENFKVKQYSGFNINNFVNTFDYNVIMVKQKLSLFISYLEFFHIIHTKHFKRFSKKMKLMDDYINDDIQFDESPRRKGSRDFDDSSSDGGSSSGGGAGAVPPFKPPAVPRKSLLKKGGESVINGLRAFEQRAKPKVDLTSNDINVNLVISESSSEISEVDAVLANLSEDNIAAITRERSETISKQLNEDPKMVTKMFDELTKTFEGDDNESVKSNDSKGSRKGSVDIKKIVEDKEEIKEEVKPEVVSETSDIIDDMLNDVNLNNPNPENNANKKKRKGKKK